MDFYTITLIGEMALDPLRIVAVLTGPHFIEKRLFRGHGS
jgi:hypothetical protein